MGSMLSCEKQQSHQSKSQSAVKRQRSALWITRTHLLNKNLNIQNKKASHNSSYVHELTSPKALKASLKNTKQFSFPRAGQNDNLCAFASNKQKKQSMQQVRLTVERYLKKRVGEQLANFTKAKSPTPSSSLPICSSAAGDALNSLIKNSKSRAASNIEIANLLKVTSGQSKGHQSKQKKKQTGLSTKQILASMNLQTPHPQIGVSKNQMNGFKLGLSVAAGGPNTGKASIPQGNTHNPRRQSQTRLEAHEVGYPVVFENKTYHLPVHKLKKKLRQQLAHQSLQSLQEAIFLQQHKNNTRLGNRQAAPLKTSPSRHGIISDRYPVQNQQYNTSRLNQYSDSEDFIINRPTDIRSKSKSPLKKSSNSRLSQRPRPISKRRSHQTKAKKQASLYDAIEISDLSQKVALDAVYKNLRGVQVVGCDLNRAHDKQQNLNPQSVTDIKSKNALFRKQEADSANGRNQDNNEQALNGNGASIDSDQKSSQTSKEDSCSDQQSVAQEVLDPMAAAAVLRELTKICGMQESDEPDDDDEDLMSHKSHRSHDHIGYEPRSLIQSQRDQLSVDDRKAFSEREVQLQSRASEAMCADWIDDSDKEEDFQDEAVGLQQDQSLASPLQESPLEEHLFSLHKRNELTIPALQAHAMARLTNQVATELSGLAQLEAKQTATDKEDQELQLADRDAMVEIDPFCDTKNRQRALNFKNQDVLEWISPDQERSSGLQVPQHPLKTNLSQEGKFNYERSVVHQMQLGTHFPSMKSLVKPKSPSNLSEESQLDDDVTPESAEKTSSALNDDLEDHMMAVAEEHESVDRLGLPTNDVHNRNDNNDAQI